MLQEAELVDRLCRSTVYQDFERSFCEVTQFPLRLSPPENRSLAGNGQVDGQKFSSATDVPVRLGDKIIGRLQIGQPPLEAAKPRHIKDSEKAKRVLGESMDFKDSSQLDALECHFERRSGSNTRGASGTC